MIERVKVRSSPEVDFHLLSGNYLVAFPPWNITNKEVDTSFMQISRD
jgi:hypothetical protein